MNNGASAGALPATGPRESGNGPGLLPGGSQARYAPPQIS
jgi:hypothetical protein